jgi:hypothetical protein
VGGAFFAEERFLAAAVFSTTFGASFGFSAPGVGLSLIFWFDLLSTSKVGQEHLRVLSNKTKRSLFGTKTLLDAKVATPLPRHWIFTHS